MTTPEVNVGVTAEDMNQVIAENPMVGMQLRIAALSRTVAEQQALIEKLQSQTKTKMGS